MLALIVILAGIIAIFAAAHFHPLVVVGLPVLLLILRRIQRQALRQFFQGRPLLDAGEPEAALERFQRLRDRLHEQPRLRRWFMLVSVYTPSADGCGHAEGTVHRGPHRRARRRHRLTDSRGGAWSAPPLLRA